LQEISMYSIVWVEIYCNSFTVDTEFVDKRFRE
jgi:hypothetical protein